MIQVFNEAPQGLQRAPHELRMLAAGHQVAVREVSFTGVHQKEQLMMAFLGGLALTNHFGRNWDALFDVLTDPGGFPPSMALVLSDYPHFRRRHARLATELEAVLLDAQTRAAEMGRKLWLLIHDSEIDPPTRP